MFTRTRLWGTRRDETRENSWTLLRMRWMEFSMSQVELWRCEKFLTHQISSRIIAMRRDTLPL